MINKLSAISLIVLAGPLQAHEAMNLDTMSHALTHLDDPLVVLVGILSVGLIGFAAVARKRKRAARIKKAGR